MNTVDVHVQWTIGNRVNKVRKLVSLIIGENP